MKIFPLENYDKNFALKMNLVTVVSILFLTRGLWISIVALMSKTKIHEIITLAYPNPEAHAAAIIAAIPVLFVLASWARRDPKANNVVRKIWQKGKLLLLVSALSNLLITCYALYYRNSIHASDVAQFTLGIICGLYLLRSSRVRALFMSFPISEQESKNRAKASEQTNQVS